MELCFVRRFTEKTLSHTVAMEFWEIIKLELLMGAEYPESRK